MNKPYYFYFEVVAKILDVIKNTMKRLENSGYKDINICFYENLQGIYVQKY